jgi:hypothetical protein
LPLRPVAVLAQRGWNLGNHTNTTTTTQFLEYQNADANHSDGVNMTKIGTLFTLSTNRQTEQGNVSVPFVLSPL